MNAAFEDIWSPAYCWRWLALARAAAAERTVVVVLFDGFAPGDDGRDRDAQFRSHGARGRAFAPSRPGLSDHLDDQSQHLRDRMLAGASRHPVQPLLRSEEGALSRIRRCGLAHRLRIDVGGGRTPGRAQRRAQYLRPLVEQDRQTRDLYQSRGAVEGSPIRRSGSCAEGIQSAQDVRSRPSAADRALFPDPRSRRPLRWHHGAQDRSGRAQGRCHRRQIDGGDPQRCRRIAKARSSSAPITA